MAKLLVIVAIIMSCGCATTYQRVGFGGGYSETQLDENVFTVNFRGNGYTSMERASDFSLLRCAELTLSHGYGYFSVVDNKSFVSSSTYSTPTTSKTTGSAVVYGNTVQGTAKTTTTGGQVYTISKPSDANTIVCFVEKPEGVFSYDAQFILNSITAKYGISTLSPNTAWEADSPDGSRSDVPEWDAPPDEDDEVENRVAVSEGISPSALFNLGIKSLNGDGGSSDPGKAAAFFLIAAKAGHPRAQYTLGTLYEKGTGVVRNYAKAVRWYRLAADQGDIDGQYALGRMFYDGKGVTQDYGEAAKWLLGAAEQGDTDAQYIVGTMFENATGVPQDKIQAHMWFNLSARLSHDEKGRRTAIEAREVLANKMTAMEVTQAQHLARDKFEHGFGPKRKR